MIKTASTLAPSIYGDATAEAVSVPSAVARSSRLTALVELTKPRIILMVLVTVAVGYVLGTRRVPGGSLTTFLVTLVGTGLVAGGASAWNQLLEIGRDRRMRRTARRPLPSGRVEPIEAALFGTLLTIIGLGILAAGSTGMAVTVATTTFVLYVFAYTPLKAWTTLNTAVGAVPGALPPVIGWAAATGRLGIEAWTLFLIVFLWQFPHFLAIAWLHREDYARAGLRMLPCVDPNGWRTGRRAVSYSLVMIPAALLPSLVGLAGPVYFAGALALSVYYLAGAARFWRELTDASARRLLHGSLLHLPATLLLLLLNPTT